MAQQISRRGGTTSEAAKAVRSEMNPDGRYIPLSGGCLGWFENSGVLKIELPNNYAFHTVLDEATVRRVLFQREGSEISRRLDERVEVERKLYVTILHEESSHSALTKDVSANGLRLQLVELTEMQKGDSLKVQLKHEESDDKVAIELGAQVMWVARVGTRRIVTNLGLGFPSISESDQRDLQMLLLGGKAE